MLKKAASWRSHRGSSGQSSRAAQLFSPRPVDLRLDGSNVVRCLGRLERIRAFSTVARRHLAAQSSFPPSNSDPIEFLIQPLELRRYLIIRVLRESTGSAKNKEQQPRTNSDCQRRHTGIHLDHLKVGRRGVRH